jgi:hypothetical protein
MLGCIAQSYPNVPAAGNVVVAVVPDKTSVIGLSSVVGSSGWSVKSPFHVTVCPTLMLMQLGENCIGVAVGANAIARGSLAAEWSFAANWVGPQPFTGVVDASGEAVSGPVPASLPVDASASVEGEELLEHAEVASTATIIAT